MLSRPTAPAHWWDVGEIFAPQDLQRSEKGTWIGVSRNGRIAVLLNVYEDTPRPKLAKTSRGALPKCFLESHASPHKWVQDMKTENTAELADIGGFTLLVGRVNPDTHHVELEILSNTNSGSSPPSKLNGTFTVSNGDDDDASWIKRSILYSQFRPLLNISEHDTLVRRSLDVLSSTSSPMPMTRQELRKHVFIPVIPMNDERYGTRAQTIITVDKSGLLSYNEYNPITNRWVKEKIRLHSSMNYD